MSLGIVEADGWQLEPIPWARHAACAGADPDVFFPGKGGRGDQARAICAACPVTDECLSYALRWNIRFGIWGGLAEQERRLIKRQWKRAGVQHGIRARYIAGCRCDDCSEANRRYQRAWRRTLFESDHRRVADIRPRSRYL